jgi:aminopeptidase N
MTKTRLRAIALATSVAVGLGMVATTPAAAAPRHHPHEGVEGASGVGDDYFPLAGNGGYDVKHYALEIRYTPDPPDGAPSGHLDGLATIEARATKSLDTFNLDLRDFTITDLTVNGEPATYSRDGQELMVDPERVIRKGRKFTVVVDYEGATGQPVDITEALYGWVSFDDGSFVANEPDGAPTWYPVNDHPTDKAAYDFRITVPNDKTAVANGLLVDTISEGDWTTYVWHAPDPMASYLSTASVGDYDLRRYKTADGLPIIDAIDRDLDEAAAIEALARTGDMIEFFEDRFGRYPFNSFGAIIDDNEEPGYNLETQTRPIYVGVPPEGTVVHELAHQWVGNSVSPEQWRDIWLNEGWATYAEWLWTEHNGGMTAAAQFDALYARPPGNALWTPAIADPGPENLFDGSIYDRGAMTLQALREKIGDRRFFLLTRLWPTVYRYDTASTKDFIKLAERVSGQQLDAFFDAWLYSATKPTSW